ncbi:cupredoxin domain-containing protein [Peribacillus asahii]|uniref:cupredoxin domain-containing protein n=1 Tax=Peribacillus asahii TaxID=228899 RepID=UPI0020799DB6|nr:cupredoxin domain-containing protein [Peribacillus asahii]USK61863.1 cupredoxin domain-containing protein [Peribacillus asahii]
MPKESMSSFFTLEIKAIDFSYKPRNITINRGKEYEITLKNDGKAEHDINIVSTEDFNENNVDNLHKNYNFHLHVQAGQSATAKISSLPRGSYIFYCTVSGHKEAGMVGNFKVL